MIDIRQGDAREQLALLLANHFHCAITSPPYFGLRSYLAKDDQSKTSEIGNETAPADYVTNLVEIGRGVRRVLRQDGTFWMNLGDSYARSGGTDKKVSETARAGNTRNTLNAVGDRNQRVPDGLKQKDLMGMPWRVAFALQADGWYLRQAIPWIKRNGMPESETGPSQTIEYIFMLTKTANCFYDAEAVKMAGAIPAGTKGAKGSAERSSEQGVSSRPPEYAIYDGTRMRRTRD